LKLFENHEALLKESKLAGRKNTKIEMYASYASSIEETTFPPYRIKKLDLDYFTFETSTELVDVAGFLPPSPRTKLTGEGKWRGRDSLPSMNAEQRVEQQMGPTWVGRHCFG
jgi:hypothetical protein